jgi:hypothetical protein
MGPAVDGNHSWVALTGMGSAEECIYSSLAHRRDTNGMYSRWISCHVSIFLHNTLVCCWTWQVGYRLHGCRVFQFQMTSVTYENPLVITCECTNWHAYCCSSKSIPELIKIEGGTSVWREILLPVSSSAASMCASSNWMIACVSAA